MTTFQSHGLRVRAMRASDLDFAAARTAAEGWRTQTRAAFEGFYAHDPEGCLIAEQDGVPVGICVGTSYAAPGSIRSPRVGFVGELIVVPEARGRGVGRRLLDAAVEHLHQAGATGIHLEGVLAAVPLYERAGFRKVCRSLRFGGSLKGRRCAGVRQMRPSDLDAVCALDRRAFGADRRFFLRRRFGRFPALGQVLELDGRVAGFVLAARVDDLLAVGPWVVRAEAARPGDLLESLAWAAPGTTLGVGILASNPAAVETARALGLVERPDPPWRMVLGEDGALGMSPMACGIGSPAKG